MNINPYQQYKPTEASSISHIPTHWEARQLGQIGVFAKGSGGNKDDEAERGLPCIRYGDIYTSYKYHARQTRSYINPDVTPHYARIEHGDALFAGSGETIEEIGKSVVNLMTQEAYCGGDVILFKPKVEIHPAYLGYVLDCPPVAYQKSRMGRGITIMHIYSSQLKYLTIPLPPLEEQAAIVRYLDHADELINRYIGAKERLIALLEEQRQAVIHQAVTRGLDPDVPLKRSDADWFIEAPKHWNTQRLKTLCTMKSGNGITTESIEPEGPYPVYGGNGIRGYSRTYTHEGHFALIGRQGALCGNVHRASGKFWASEHAVVASLKAAHSLDWFVPLLEVMNLNQYSIAAAQPGLSVDRVMNLNVPVPPFKEQTKIGDIINESGAATNSAVSQVRRQIDLEGV